MKCSGKQLLLQQLQELTEVMQGMYLTQCMRGTQLVCDGNCYTAGASRTFFSLFRFSLPLLPIFKAVLAYDYHQIIAFHNLIIRLLFRKMLGHKAVPF